VNRTCSDTQASLHLQRCRAHCSKCYYNLLRLNRNIYYRRESSSCKCETVVENNSISYWGGSMRRYTGTTNQQTPTKAEHPVCRSCNALSEESMLSLREKRDMDEIKQLVRHPLTCADCRISLSTGGPRWWICSRCTFVV
jgi:hypothetical protein